MTAPQTGATTDPRIIIALQQRLDEALAREAALTEALARRDSEYDERIEYQSATIDVLKAMSASPADPQPVFDLIVRHANELCNGTGCGIFEFDGVQVHIRASNIGAVGAANQSAVTEYLKLFPMAPIRGSYTCRAILDRQIVHITDTNADVAAHPLVKALGYRSQLSIPLMRNGTAVGAISLGGTPGGFSHSQIALLQTFAEQAVIAITSAETYRELQARTNDLQESLEHQTATSDVLKVVSRSAAELQPVLDTLVETAARICRAESGFIFRIQDDLLHMIASFGIPAEYKDFQTHNPIALNRGSLAGRTALEGRAVQIEDAATDPEYTRRQAVQLGNQRTMLGTPLIRDDTLIGVITLARSRVERFSEKETALVTTFADQAVIAMENARLITDQREALEQQTATAEVLQVINSSPGDLAPVFDTILQKARLQCDAIHGDLWTYDGDCLHLAATHGEPGFSAWLRRQGPLRPWSGSPPERIVRGEDCVHIEDALEDAAYVPAPESLEQVKIAGIRTTLLVALRKENVLLGLIVVYRRIVRPFNDKQIALLRNFAAQAVIAMENARLLDEIRQRQDELRITFENMGDGVAMFDETPRLVAWNRKFQEILDVPDHVLAEPRTYADYIRYLAIRGEYGADVDPEAQLRHFQQRAGEHYVLERTRPDGRIIEVRHNPVPGGGFVLIYADITERKRNEADIRAARDAAEEASRTIEASYRDLQAAQANLIQAEKMASLGQLTAGIAHEIKNPLNFVNNFASLSVDLLEEMKQTAAPCFAMLDDAGQAEIDYLTRTLSGNLEKINEHGNRADAIVRSMLEHSRGSSGEQRSIDLNDLVDEALNLAYHGARAQNQNFNVTLQRDFGNAIAPITVAPQEVTRVLLNLFSNGFYAARQRQQTEVAPGFEPTVKVVTRELGDAVEIRVRDNGIGISDGIKDKLFQPFFTTKPSGEGTGLGLSISYDIITQQHGGHISVDSKVGEYSEFTIRLPRDP